MNKYYPHLFQPFELKDLIIKNRIGMAPASMTSCGQAPEGGMSDDRISLMESVAAGGTAIVNAGEVSPGLFSPDNLCYLTNPQIIQTGDPKVYKRLVMMAEALHRHGAIASIELAHAGAIAPPAMNQGKRPIGPNPLPNDARFTRGAPCNAIPMTEYMMNEVANDFADSVALLKQAGYDMVMLHAGHGTLFYEFMSSVFNKRTDGYGGTPENRVRFINMVASRIKERVGWNFPLEIRISGSEVLDDGYTVDEMVQMCHCLADTVDMIHVSCGGGFHNEGRERMFVLNFLERGANVKYASAVKKSGIKIPVACVGGIADPSQMEEILRDGHADFIYMAHALIADPDIAKKAQRGKADELRRCIRCHSCQVTSVQSPQHMMRCSINPLVGHWGKGYDSTIPAPQSKRVLIVGGGPAGMEAALTAASRGHQVILCEKQNRLGGALWFSEKMSFKQDIFQYMERMAQRCLKHPGIEVRLNTNVTKEYAAEQDADVLFAAIGARHIVPPIPGIDGAQVMTASEALLRSDQLGETIVVIGGGMVGCETGVHLGELGKKVSILELTSKFCGDAHALYAYSLGKKMAEYTTLYPNAACMEIRDGEVLCEQNGKSIRIEADNVIIAAGMKANYREAWALAGDVDEFYCLGDCNKKAGKIMNATTDGFFAAMDI